MEALFLQMRHSHDAGTIGASEATPDLQASNHATAASTESVSAGHVSTPFIAPGEPQSAIFLGAPRSARDIRYARRMLPVAPTGESAGGEPMHVAEESISHVPIVVQPTTKGATKRTSQKGRRGRGASSLAQQAARGAGPSTERSDTLATGGEEELGLDARSETLSRSNSVRPYMRVVDGAAPPDVATNAAADVRADTSTDIRQQLL